MKKSQKKFYKKHLDEHNLIGKNTNCLFMNKDRKASIKDAIDNLFDVAILDDGFQDFSIKKDLNILCFNAKSNKP